MKIHFHCAAIAQGVSQYCCWRTTRAPHLTRPLTHSPVLTLWLLSLVPRIPRSHQARPEGSSQHLDRPWSHRGGGLGPSKWWWARVGPGMLLWSGGGAAPAAPAAHPLGIPVIQSSEHQRATRAKTEDGGVTSRQEVAGRASGSVLDGVPTRVLGPSAICWREGRLLLENVRREA